MNPWVRHSLLSTIAAVLLSGAAAAATVTIPDGTLLERWNSGMAAPEPGDTRLWYDVIGGSEFETTQARITRAGRDVTLSFVTKFPEGGSESHGSVPPGESLYKPADVAIDLDRDGVWELGIALSDHAGPGKSHDTRWPDPPGSSKPADTFKKGGIYSVASNDDWFWANDIHMHNSTLGGRYDEANPKASLVWMRLGTKVGEAKVTWTQIPGFWQIDVFLDNVNTQATWNDFDLLWGTATCGNDVIAGRAAVAEPGTLLLLGAGFAGFAGMARRHRSRARLAGKG